MDGIPETLDELRTVLRADLVRNASGAERLTVTIFRLGQFCHASSSWLAVAIRPLWKIVDLLYLRLLIQAELPPRFRCGAGLALPHAGRGVVIHENARLGENSMVFHRVTIGTHVSPIAPDIGDNAYIGTGACIVGPITVGRHVRVGANAVVVSDVAPWTSVGGVPATVIGTRAPTPD